MSHISQSFEMNPRKVYSKLRNSLSVGEFRRLRTKIRNLQMFSSSSVNKFQIFKPELRKTSTFSTFAISNLEEFRNFRKNLSTRTSRVTRFAAFQVRTVCRVRDFENIRGCHCKRLITKVAQTEPRDAAFINVPIRPEVDQKRRFFPPKNKKKTK